MTQTITGTGLGIYGSSIGMGGHATHGSSSLGQGGESAYVNAANGNLILRHSDGFLADIGFGFDLFQTYNSLGERGGSWCFNVQSRIELHGEANQEGSYVIRIGEDGHRARFNWNTTRQQYVPEEGGTANLRFTTNGWIYKDGSGKTSYEYDRNGQLMQISDQDNHHLKFNYVDGHLSSIVSTSERQKVTWTFNRGLLTDITTSSDKQQVHHIHYDYDEHQRLHKVSRDLGDGKSYWITYDYVGDSNRISTVKQSDGTRLSIDYDAQGRVQKLIDGEGCCTTYTYASGHTTLTNSLGESWTYFYDERDRLIAVEGPENYRISYRYEGNHLISVTQGTQVWHYRYNEAGDCIYIQEPNGHITQRSFDAEHHLLLETTYQAFDGNHHPIKPKTTRYTYDAQGHLRFIIAADGTVTEYRYNLQGQLTSSRCYLKVAYNLSSLAEDSCLNQEQMEKWSAQQNPQQISLVEYSYDWRGQLSEETHYSHVTAEGLGILDAQATRSHTVYDAAGRLCEKSTPTANGWSTTYYFYDDMGRLIQTIDNQGHTQNISYDDAHQQIIQTDANGLQTIKIYDRSGLLIATHCLDAHHDFGTTSYQYDEAGRLIAETGVDGLNIFYFYDAQGRLNAKVNKQGQLTRYSYNEEGLLVQTHQYSQRISTEGWLEHYPAFASIIPVSTKKDSISQIIYDEYQRVAYSIDATGAVIGYTYNAEGKIVSKTAYAQRLADYQPETLLTKTSLKLNSSTNDRSIHYYYDLNGNVVAELNAEGYVSEYRYDRQGHVIETIRYSQAITNALSGDWQLDKPSAQSADIHTYTFYDAQGQKIASVDGERYLTEYRYDANGQLIERIAYATAIAAEFELGSESLETIRPPQHGNDHHSYYTYDDLGQLSEEKSPNGLTTTYTYNEMGLLISKSRMDARTRAIREQQYRYDALGRIIQELDELGCAKLKQQSLTDKAIKQIWQEHSIHYAYDNAGLLRSKTDALQRTSRYFYNEYGQLQFTVNAQGGIVETRYNALNQIESTCKYSAPLSLKSLKTVTLKDIQAYLEQVKDEHFDETSWYEYNSIGQVVAQHKGAKGVVTSKYNAFGELEQSIEFIDATHSKSTQYSYDRRGLLSQRTDDFGGLNRAVKMHYDAFGLMDKYTDGRGKTTRYGWNKRGEQIKITNPQNKFKKTGYDAFGRVISESDNLQREIRHYTYDDQNNKLTLKDPQRNSEIITEYNAFGDKLSLIDGNKNTTTFSYDERGLLIRVDAPENATKAYHYDAAGQLQWQEDSGGHKIAYTYDAQGHVLTKTLDPDGLNLVTSYAYDAIGRQIQISENKRVTQFTYNDQGLLVKSCVDPKGLNLITEYSYDARGLLLRKTEVNRNGHDKVTAYTWDNLDRCTASIQDPDNLNLATYYQYDENDNLICQTDARGNSTHYVYDVNNQCRYQINARGVVTEHIYNANGCEAQTIIYAKPITLGGNYSESSLSTLLAKDAKDQYTFREWDAAGRLEKLFDALGYATLYKYDSNDNIVSITKSAVAVSLEDLKAGKPIELERTRVRHEYFAYDGLNQLCFQYNTGSVTESRYDAHGQVIERIQYATPLSISKKAEINLEYFQKNCTSNSQNKITRYAYDQAGRMTVELSPQGIAKSYTYNELNQVISCTRYATLITGDNATSLALDSLVLSNQDRTNYFVYDTAGRERYRISAEGQVVERRYDDVGNVISQITHGQRASTKENTLARLDELLAEDSNARSSKYSYDALGRLEKDVNAKNLETSYQYDSNGNVSQKIEANKAVWTYRYDELNRLTETRSPKVAIMNEATPRSISTKKEYDSFGNVISETRDAEGIAQKRCFEYDAMNRLTKTTYPGIKVNNASEARSAQRQEISKDLSELSTYNAFGEVIARSDRAGRWQHFAYDMQGQLVYQVDTRGALTQYDYDAFGRVTKKIRYDKELAVLDEYSTEKISRACIKGNADRTESYDYDLDDRLIETRRDAVLTYNPRDKTYSKVQPSIRNEYNAFGEIVKTIKRLDSSRNAITLMYYNQDGQQTAQIDAEGYLTTYELNAFGEVECCTEFASRTQKANVNGYSLPASHSKDRTVTFTYDALGQVTSKILKNVEFSRLVKGKLETIRQDIPTYYRYDAMGHLVETTDAKNNTAYCYYDALGQLTAKIGPGQKIRSATTYSYDALGNLLQTHKWANGAELTENKGFVVKGISAADQVSSATFDAFGQVISETNAMNHTVNYSYDEVGNLVRSFQTVGRVDGSKQIRDIRYEYDSEHNLVKTRSYKENNQQHIEEARYNIFGEMTEKGMEGKSHIHIDYDLLGHAWRSNVQGYYQIFLYDATDEVTQIVTSANGFHPEGGERGVDLGGEYFSKCMDFNDGNLHQRLQRQNATYDALGHLLSQVREYTVDVLDKDGLRKVVESGQTQSIDRWGNVLSHTNALGYTTHYEYNLFNQVTRQELPEVSFMNEQGVRSRIKPVNQFAYDELGQVIAAIDAKNHRTTRAYDAEGHVIQETDAKGISRSKKYNLLGQLSSTENELHGITEYTYDHENRLTQVRTYNSQKELNKQKYTYDEVGQLLVQENGANEKTTFTYDTLGNQIRKTSARGFATAYEYDDYGHKIKEVDASQKQQTWTYDAYGHLLRHTDLGNHTTTYEYNVNGLLLHESSTSGKNIYRQYQGDGQLITYEDRASKETVRYSYDLEGQMRSKLSSRSQNIKDSWLYETDFYTYDELGRLSSVRRHNPDDLPNADKSLLWVDYDYDEVGNIRHTAVQAKASGTRSGTASEAYYLYDENNRMTLNKGELQNGQIVFGTKGSRLAYDNAGNVSDAESYENGKLKKYHYVYDQANQLVEVSLDGKRLQAKNYDLAGRVTEEYAYDKQGHQSQVTTLTYTDGLLTHQSIRDQNKKEISYVNYSYDTVDNITDMIITNNGGPQKKDGSTIAHSYTYELWDSYQQKTDSVVRTDYHSTGKTRGVSTRNYDQNGLLNNVEDAYVDKNNHSSNIKYLYSSIDGLRIRQDGNSSSTSYLSIAGKTIGSLRVDADKQELDIYGGFTPTGGPTARHIKLNKEQREMMAELMSMIGATEDSFNKAPTPVEAPQDNIGTYTLKSGDSLESIALQVYGDSSLWYLIADANGISDRNAIAGGDSKLYIGQRLTIPPAAAGQHHTHATHRILDANKMLGNTSANAATPTPKPPKPKHGNFWGKLLVAVVATVATVLTAGALAIGMGVTGSIFSAGLSALGGTITGTAGAAGIGSVLGVGLAAGFVGSIAGQTAANLMGMQSGVDFGGALISGLATAATAGIGYGLKNIGTFKNLSNKLNNYNYKYFNSASAVEMMEQNAASQAFNTTIRRHQHFDWTELGVATLTGGVMGSKAGKEFGKKLETLDNHTGMLRAELQTLTGAGAQSLTTGTHFDALHVLGDNLGSVIGNAVVSGMASPHYLDEYNETMNELSIDGLLSDYQETKQKLNDYRESPQLVEEERNVPVHSSEGYNGGYCAIPVEDNNYSAIPDGFYDKAQQTQLSEAAGKIWENYGDEILRYGPKALGIWGSGSPASETGTSLTTSDYLKIAGSIALDFIPIVGQLKAAEQMWFGKDPLTGWEINRGEAAFGLVPGGKLISTLKALGKAGSKTIAVEKLLQTVPNKSSPSVAAKGFQGSRDYPGIDKYRDITLKKGTIVYAGEPGVTGFFTTSSAIHRSKLDATALFEGLQVSPRNGLYRPGVTAFEIIEDTPAAFGITRANPKYGVGGLPQLYIPNYANITKPVISYPLNNRFMRGK
ncbi:LysM peptidoglycan-binding domain-containing protein [Legionella lytica]|uniref:LysM peptidoglycan-binding domain-containing protein n=1 Tax=Legionella lytica TaxID=96232 RepID=A0ABY4Y8G4_9GAMM|nr:pre-toxin TG domain-containing protein [Legionella lytica]USQ13731.1 LysM peptidoglycan-binding domain-containing protein [Legionella lytica]